MRCVCGKVLCAITENQKAFSAARVALEDGWKWVAGESISARRIYNHLEQLSEFETSATTENEINAICAVELTVQYVAWHAFRIELEGVAPQTRPVPNDLADITEDIMKQIVDHATAASPDVLSCIENVLSGHQIRARHTKADELGPPVSKRDFGL